MSKAKPDREGRGGAKAPEPVFKPPVDFSEPEVEVSAIDESVEALATKTMTPVEALVKPVPAGFVKFPKMVYRGVHTHITVNDEKELQEKLAQGWSESP